MSWIRASRMRLQVRHVAQLVERRARASGPRDVLQALRGAAHREPVADDAEGEVVGEQFGPGTSMSRPEAISPIVSTTSHSRCRS